MNGSPIWTIECDGGCGRFMQTSRLTTLWTVTKCSECAEPTLRPEGE